MKTLHLIVLAAGAAALLAALGGLIAWHVVKSNCSGANLDWWKHSVIYQIYPLSFKDSDGDGIGDLEGITDKMSHFKDAGVDAIVMTPMFKSPLVDFGYDIIDFCEFHDIFGEMEDFENLVNRAHDIGIKVLLVLPVNQASTISEYFKKSEAGDPEYRDFFVWADGIPDPDDPTKMLPPSNWRNQFEGPAWQWSEKRKQFYLHQFSIDQADFNFRNPAVRKEMRKIITFWLDKGVDGFRADALSYLIEADPAEHGGRYPDNPVSPVYEEVYNVHQSELYDVLYEWWQLIDKYNEEHGGDTRIIISEAHGPINEMMIYYGEKRGAIGAHFPLNYNLMTDLTIKCDARDYVYIIQEWLTYMPHGGVANWAIGNHDFHRLPNRFRPDMVDGLNSMVMMLPGTLFSYQGEEIGMNDGYVSWNETLDVTARHRNETTYYEISRDPVRTPYQWDDSTSAGFSINADTWLPVGDDYEEINLARQKEEERSHFKVYQALTALRKEKTLSHGDYDIKALTSSSFYVVRSLRTYDTLVFLFNVGEDPDTIVLSRVAHLKTPAIVYISSIHSSKVAGDIVDGETLTLAAGEALILRAPPVS